MAFWIILTTTLVIIAILAIGEVRKFPINTRLLFILTLVSSAIAFGALFTTVWMESSDPANMRPASEKTYSLQNLNNADDVRLYLSVGEAPRALNYIYYDETNEGNRFAVAASAPAEDSRIFQHVNAVDPVVTITEYTYQNSFLLPFEIKTSHVTYDFSIPEQGIVESAITKKVGN